MYTQGNRTKNLQRKMVVPGFSFVVKSDDISIPIFSVNGLSLLLLNLCHPFSNLKVHGNVPFCEFVVIHFYFPMWVFPTWRPMSFNLGKFFISLTIFLSFFSLSWTSVNWIMGLNFNFGLELGILIYLLSILLSSALSF